MKFTFYIVSNRLEEYTMDTLNQDFGHWRFGVSGHYGGEFIFEAAFGGSAITIYYGAGSMYTPDIGNWTISDKVHEILAAQY